MKWLKIINTLLPFTAMCVNPAAQTLSQSVAAGINTLFVLNHQIGEANTATNS